MQRFGRSRMGQLHPRLPQDDIAREGREGSSLSREECGGNTKSIGWYGHDRRQTVGSRFRKAQSRIDAQKARLVFAPKGLQHVSPGQSVAAKPRSAALGHARHRVTRGTAVRGAARYAPSWFLRRTGRHENEMVGGF